MPGNGEKSTGPPGPLSEAGKGGDMPADREEQARSRAGRRAMRIAGIYGFCGFVWIILSDRLLAALIQDSDMLTRLQTYKGWAFILITAALVFALSRRALLQPEHLAEEVRELENRTRSIIESIPVGMHLYHMESDGRLVFIGANPAADKILGVDSSTFIGKTIEDALPALKKTEIPQRYREAAASGKPWHTESIDYHDGAIHSAFEVRAFQTDPNTMVAAFVDITHRKQSELALQQSEAKYRRLYDETPVLLHSIDRNGTVVEVNDYWLKTLGYERNEVIGRKVTDFFMESSRKYAQEVIQPAFFRDGIVKDIPYQFVKKNGDIVDALLSATAERDAAGNVIRSFAVIQDITERKAAEVALQKSEKMLQTIIDAEPECVKVLDESACLIMMNHAGLSMLQVDSLDQVRGQCVCPMVTSEYRSAFMDLTKRVFQGEAGTLIFEMVGLKGRHLWLETHAVPLRNEKDEIIALLGVTRDVTERKRAEEELREKEGKYRLLFESANDGIFIQDETGFTDCNQKGARMYGLSKEEIIGRLPSEFAPERQPDGRLSAEVAGEKVQAALSGVPQVFEWQPLRADGSPFDVEITLSRLELGGKMCLQAIVRDISERKRLEQEHLKSQKLESIGTLAGGIAHDFNNLLQGVFGYISMAKLTHDQREKSLSMLEQAEKALHQSVNLTSQLLTFAKGGKPLKKALSLRPVIENSVKFAMSGSRVDHELAIADDLRAIEADEGQISQVIQNIVLNADQAMPLGGTIMITARNSLDREGFVEIAIKDTGVGIPAEYLTKIFDPYFTTKEKGSGLGLATSYSIITNHDGVIKVSSALGRGSTFTIYLPAAGDESEEAAGPAAPRIARKGRVLVMDDEELVRNVAYELLTGLGHDVELAREGEEAVEKYRQAKAAGRPFNVTILDLTIRGGMGGAETMRKLMEIDPGVTAIVSSGYSDDTVVSNYRDHGFAAFLKKPYDLTGVQATLNELMT